MVNNISGNAETVVGAYIQTGVKLPSVGLALKACLFAQSNYGTFGMNDISREDVIGELTPVVGTVRATNKPQYHDTSREW